MGLATVADMGGITTKFSQRLHFSRWENVKLNDETGMFELNPNPEFEADFYGTLMQRSGQKLQFNEIGTRVEWTIACYTNRFFDIEPDGAYAQISYRPNKAEYDHFYRVLSVHRWDNGQLWVYYCTWQRSGQYATATPIVRTSEIAEGEGTLS